MVDIKGVNWIEKIKLVSLNYVMHLIVKSFVKAEKFRNTRQVLSWKECQNRSNISLPKKKRFLTAAAEGINKNIIAAEYFGQITNKKTR